MTRHIAFLFPGQGSQAVGMGKSFFEASAKARELYEAFNRIVAPQLSQLCFEGPEAELRRTLYTQPAILITALVAYELFREKANIQPVVTAGHSLGEYGALYASGVIDLETAAHLVKKRAELMDAAQAGAMSAVLGLPETQVEKVILHLNNEGNGPITVANYNMADQYVISGTPAAVEQAGLMLKEAGAKRVLPLPVSGAFHSPLMDSAAGEFRTFLQGFSFHNAQAPVITNVDAQLTHKAGEFQEKLGDQINHSVRWTHTMQRMVVEQCVDTVIEFGPGKVLTGMMKKTYPDVATFNVSDMASLEETLAQVREKSTV